VTRTVQARRSIRLRSGVAPVLPHAAPDPGRLVVQTAGRVPGQDDAER